MSKLISVNPFTNKQISSFDALSREEISNLVHLSHQTFSKYRLTKFEDRKTMMQKASSLLEKNSRQYAEIISLEMGKLFSEAEAEIKKCAWVCSFYAEQAEFFLSGRTIESDASHSEVQYQPLGPVLAIMPWNFPFWQVFRFAAPALMAGNTALLKHASNVQGCAMAIEKIFLEAGFPEAVFQNLAIKSSQVKWVIEDPALTAVTLTGSESAGKSVASLAGKNLKKCVLELGGSNAFVVLNDADLDLAVDTAIMARLLNAGQSCIAAKRFILEEGIHDAFLSLLVDKLKDLQMGDPMSDTTRLSPLVSIQQAEEVERQVRMTEDEGAILLYGGRRNNSFFEPTVLSGVKPGMTVFEEETFGPVFSLTKAQSPEEALAFSNASAYGLGMQLFTRSETAEVLFAEHADEGAVFINGMVKSDPRLPFGGVKRSGYGRELSREGILEFVNVKTIWRR